ncbi:MFS transporter, partial [Burkholderia contaminans]
SGNSLFTMMQMLAMGLGVSIGGGLVNLFAAYWGSMAHGFMLSFTCMGVVTLLSSVVFRRIDTAAPPASAAARPSA